MIKFIALLCALFSCVVSAADPESIFQQAKQTLVKGDEPEAERLFQHLQSMPLTELQKNQIRTFRNGHQLFLKKKLRLAKRLMNNDKCEQAISMYQSLSDYRSTRRQAQLGLKKCRHDSRESLRIFGLVQFSSGYDDNPARINQDVNGNNDDLNGSGFQRVKAQLNLKASFDPGWALGIGARVSEQDYFQDQADLYAASYQQLNAQLVYNASRHWQWSLPLRTRNTQYDGNGFNQWWSIGSQLNWRNQQWRQRFSLESREYQYQQNSQQKFDGSEQRLAYTLSRFIGKHRIDAGVRWRERVASSAADYDHHQVSGIIRWRSGDVCWSQLCSFTLLSAQVYQRSYHANDPASLYFDRNYQGQSLALKWRNRWSDWQLDLNGKWQKRHSNDDSYSYQRGQIDLALGYRF